jgi:hypothetical protein
VLEIKKLKSGQIPTKGCRAIDRWMDGRNVCTKKKNVIHQTYIHWTGVIQWKFCNPNSGNPNSHKEQAPSKITNLIQLFYFFPVKMNSFEAW